MAHTKRDIVFITSPATSAAPSGTLALSFVCPVVLIVGAWVLSGSAAPGASGPLPTPVVGLALCAALFSLFSAAFLPPTLFTRPHASFWRVVVGLGLLYALFLAYLLCQPLTSSQVLFQWLAGPDNGTGTAPLPQKSYAENCELTVHNLSDNVDVFVVAHLVGWVGKAFMFRDFWFTMAQSFTFELLEYTFEYLQVRSWRPLCHPGGWRPSVEMLGWASPHPAPHLPIPPPPPPLSHPTPRTHFFVFVPLYPAAQL